MQRPPWVQSEGSDTKQEKQSRRSRSPNPKTSRSRSRSPVRRRAPLPSQDSQKPAGPASRFAKGGRYEDRRDERRQDGSITIPSDTRRLPGGQDATHDAEPERPNYGLSGALAAESKTKAGTVLKYHEPAEAAKPTEPWRLYVYRGKTLEDTLHLSQQSAFLLGRDAAVADIPLPDASCSKQHAVIQFRQVEKQDAYGERQKRVRPYLIDLGSTNGSFVNRKEIPQERHYELRSEDMLAFGDLSLEFVLLRAE